MGSQGVVTKAASDAFDEALKLDAKHLKAHYYAARPPAGGKPARGSEHLADHARRCA